MKRHLDQIITTEYIITRSVPSSTTKSSSVAAASESLNESVILVVVPLFSPSLAVVDPTSDSFLSPGLRGSSRVKRLVVRLDL